jgi:FkbM family methyltransferase
MDVVDAKTLRRIRINKSNAPFVVDILNSFEYYFSSVEPFKQRINGTLFDIVDFSSPRYHKLNKFNDFPVLYPTLAEPFITIEQYLDKAGLREGDVVLDLGAYSGLTAICFSKVVGNSGKVVAVEPDPITFAAAEKNISQHIQVNKLNNITLMNNAAAGSHKTIPFSSEGTLGSAGISIVGLGRGDVVDVSCLTLAEIAERNNLSKIDFVKIDIEGAEEEVILAARAFLVQYRPKLIIEPHFVDGILSANAVMEVLRGYGYRAELMEQFGVELPLIYASPMNG